MAEKQKIEDTRKEDNVEEDVAAKEDSAEVSATDGVSAEENTQAQDVNNKTPAEKKREEMQAAGKSLLRQGENFILDSRRANKEDLQAESEIEQAATKSTNEIETLEGEMSALISRAESVRDTLKNEYENINKGDKNNKITFAKINRLQQKLQQYGTQGQARLAASEGDFVQYEAIMNSKNGKIFNAQDIGAVTVDVGNELLTQANKTSFIFNPEYIIGRNAVYDGTTAISNADKTEGIKEEAIHTNHANESRVQQLKNNLEGATGVEGYSLTADGEQAKEDKEKIKTQTAAATETDKAASASLDQVLLAKLRRGQDIEA
jgi:DNA repair exonuclease SbcCD ATPase subunit